MHNEMLNKFFVRSVFIGNTHYQTFHHETGIKSYAPITEKIDRKEWNPSEWEATIV